MENIQDIFNDKLSLFSHKNLQGRKQISYGDLQWGNVYIFSRVLKPEAVEKAFQNR